MSGRVPSALLLLLVLAAPLRAGGEDAAAAWRDATASSAARLAALAVQAHRRKLYASRDVLYARVLTLAPDHRQARKWLKYKRAGGAWTRTRYTPPKDRGSKDARAEQQTALAGWQAWWLQRVLEVHAAALEAGDETTAAEVVRVALVSLPDTPRVRELAGEVRHGTGAEPRWIHGDTQRGLEHRARFLKAALAATKAVQAPKPGHLETVDLAERFPWPVVLQGETMRVLGAVEKQETALHHQIAEAAAGVFAGVFGTRPRPPSERGRYSRGYSVYVASGREKGNAFLATDPKITPRDMEFLQTLVAGRLRTRPGVVVKAETEALRLEATSRMIQGMYTARKLGQNRSAKGAWAKQAVSHYLAWLQVRTRVIHQVRDRQGGRYATGRPGVPTWLERLADQTVDWHTLAADALEELSIADVHMMVGKDVNNLDTRDMLAGYGIAVFLIEAHPETSVAFFRDVGGQTRVDLDAVLRKHVGRDFAALRPHLLRWLREMGELAPAPGTPR